MSEQYTVTARKFRPRTFSQIVGQPHIVRTLTNAIVKKRIGHAYLFSGTRGVGKTTTARILAKALNCANGPTPEPCLECENCKEIEAGSSMDVIEIDGASNTGIDNIRELRENAQFTPSKSTYKIYIIDEVHQISKAAFNALLKTLEEPPPHVKFIFATTELVKVPETILSRCQSFEYRSISVKDISDQLKMIAEHENINITAGAIELLSRRAAGSMRDAQSLFDQAAAYGGGSVTEEDIKLILGMVDKALLFDVIDATIRQDRRTLLDLVEKAAYTGSDPALFVEDLAETARNIMVAKINPERLTEYGEEEKNRLKQWAQTLDFDEIQRYFQVLTKTMEDMKRSSQPALVMEMGVLRLSEKRGLVKIDDLIDNVSKAETAIEKKMVHSNPPAQETVKPTSPVDGGSGKKHVSIAVDSNVEKAPREIESAFNHGSGSGLLQAFMDSDTLLRGILDNAVVQIKDDVMVIYVNDMFTREKLEKQETKLALEKIAEDKLNRKIRLVAMVNGEKKNGGDKQDRKDRDREVIIKRQMIDMPIVQKAMEIFSGEIEDVRIPKDI